MRDHTNKRSIYRWRITNVEGLRGLPIDKRPRWLRHGPSRRHRWRSRMEGKSFGMESGALERKGSRCITFPLAPCLCCYSLGVVDHRTTETFAWVGDGASWLARQCDGPGGDVCCCNRLLTPPTCVHLCGNVGACRLGCQDFRRLDLV